MSLPKLTGMTPADIAEFDAIIDCLKHGEAKFLDAWMNRMIAAQIVRDAQTAAELEALRKQLDAQTQHETVADFIAEACAPPLAPETIH
jgi:hypothetical protein